MKKVKISRWKKNGKTVLCVDTRYALKDGRRHFFSLKQKAEAENLVKKTNAQIDDAPVILTGAEKRDYETARDVLGDVSFSEAAYFYRKTHRATSQKTVLAALELFIASKERAKKDSQYMLNLRSRVTSLATSLRDTACDSITHDQVEHWLHSREWSQYTKNRALIDLKTFFSFALKNGFVSSNPIDGVERIEVGEFEKGILTPAQAKIYIETTAENCGLLRYVADQLFGGLREDEARFLTPDKVNEKYIEISGKQEGDEKRHTKTGENRYVDFNDTWLKWRNAAPAEYWKIRNFNRRMQSLKKAIREKLIKQKLAPEGYQFPLNCLRHSFCTYAAKKWGPGRAAEMAGHSEAMQKKNYRRPVTAEDADAFWAILPPE